MNSHGEKDSNRLLNCWPRIPSLDTTNIQAYPAVQHSVSLAVEMVYITQMDIYGREDQTARAFFYSNLCKVVFHIIFPLLLYSTFLHTEKKRTFMPRG